ncbi:MAG: hypothetical protein R3E79_62225 [Caldilineaceae bacterium]
MATKRNASRKHPLTQNSLVRILGHHAPAHLVLEAAAQQGTLPIAVRITPTPPVGDYALIDPALAVEPEPSSVAPLSALPPSGAGYAAFTPGQRHQLLQWLNQPTEAAPPAFQHFYLAQLEVGLLDVSMAAAVMAEVQRLQQAPAWRNHLGLARLRLLAHWLAQEGSGLAAWLGEEGAPGPLLGVALGLQALLQQPLLPQQVVTLFRHWAPATALPGNALLTLRISSLATTLGREPLAYALAQLAETQIQPQPWRSQHRDLRLVLPQPDLRPPLTPLLRDLTLMDEATGDPGETTAHDKDYDDTFEDKGAAQGWQLVLEFGESRSDFFALALTAAQKQPGYVALMDEDRHMIHRVHFRKGEVRRFWRLWEYVQSWSSTKVYLNGDEISKTDLYARLWQVR